MHLCFTNKSRQLLKVFLSVTTQRTFTPSPTTTLFAIPQSTHSIFLPSRRLVAASNTAMSSMTFVSVSRMWTLLSHDAETCVINTDSKTW